MGDRRLEQLMRKLASLLLIVLPAAFAVASEVEVIALFKDRAVLRTAGAEHMLKVGDTSPDGVELLAADARGARVRYGGQIHTLSLSTPIATAFSPSAPARIAIARDGQGQYRVAGTINGQPAEFLVDTGASLVVLSSARARALGLAFEQAEQGSIQTAQGTVPAFFLALDAVSVAGMESQAVGAAVVEGDYPADILLGMSFLRDVSIEARDGVLTLVRRD